ncbi:uncharacterized protein LOC111591645 [Ceratitis capitata]|uniref:uncharacterized protein LOC111591645 n=1 Tax=Ceratitis capitata TaxID=7213 RepID=UPI000C6C596E|nr:uncharacterized protein LOC111591645 [Ceratitis capitata]
MDKSLAADRFWVDKANCHNAERQYHELLSKQEKVKQLSGKGYLNGVQEPACKLKKVKKMKNKKNEYVAKLTEISTNSESEERLLLTGSQVNAPFESIKLVGKPIEVSSKPIGEKPKKRNRGAKKNADVLVSNIYACNTFRLEIIKFIIFTSS